MLVEEKFLASFWCILHIIALVVVNVNVNRKSYNYIKILCAIQI